MPLPTRALRAGISSIAPSLLLASAAHALPPVPVPTENPITEEKRILGKILFWDEQLSAVNTMACATCHTPGRGGSDARIATNPGVDGLFNTADDRHSSPGVVRSDSSLNFIRDLTYGLTPQVTPRTAQSNINGIYSPVNFWDGRAADTFKDPVTGQTIIAHGGSLESQSVNPPASASEMGHDGVNWTEITTKLASANPLDLATNFPADVGAVLSSHPSYPDLFQQAFGDSTISASRIAMAIATYERTLVPDQSPYDRFLAGQTNALTQQQQQGLQAFNASNCTACHAGPLLTDQSFRNVGLRPPAEDTGREVVTGNTNDRGKFKVPSLRNVGLKSVFMHNGEFSNITDVIRFYAKAPGAAQQFPDNQDPAMNNVRVPPQAGAVIQDFLTNALTDPRVANSTFPFDHPTLASQRSTSRTTILGGGTAGTGGVIPKIIADMPGLLGTTNFRVGLDGGLTNSTARLILSFAPPASGKLSAAYTLGEVTTAGTTSTDALATFFISLSPNIFQGGQTIYFQWAIDDPSAPNGTALSQVASVPVFCGSSGCPAACPADFNDDGFLDFFDFANFVACFEGGECPIARSADYNNDGFADFFDFSDFVTAFEAGC